MKGGFTLIEMLISISIFAIIMLSTVSIITSSVMRIKTDVEVSKLRAEINYALDHIKLHSITASKIDSNSFFPSSGGKKDAFTFRGESDIYKITPSNVDDDTWYTYYKNSSNNIVLRNEMTRSEEILVNSRFNPQITFEYKKSYEPNFLEVTITGEISQGAKKIYISKTAGIRFWFVNIVK
jgi:prepilin-type N-terminal cleavage/methylation domain-containing protein